jgi:hypothetical protein
LESPLRFNSVSFSENILAGAVLFEPSYAATSRITQQAGTLVLKAEVTSNEITRLAFIALDATNTSGSTIRLRANDIIVDGQTTFFNNLKTLGVASRTGVNTTIRSATAPTTRNDDPIAPTPLVAGDIWIKTGVGVGDLPHTYDGTTPFNVSGWVQAYTVIDGGSVSTGAIRSADYVHTSGDFSTAGTEFDLTNGRIRSENFAITSAGDAKFKGDIEATSGSLSGLTVDGVLEITSAGLIQNDTQRYFITVDGMVLTSLDDIVSPTTGSSIQIIRASTTLTIAQFFGRHDTFSGDEWAEITAEDYLLISKVGGSVNWAKISSNGIEIYPTTESTNTTSGSIITAGGVGIAKNLHVGGTGNFTGALNAPVVGVTSVSATPYTVLATDTHIAVDNNANPFTVNLPAGTAGRKVTIFDKVGGAGVGTITINANGSENIKNLSSITLTTAYQSVTLLFTPNKWIII